MGSPAPGPDSGGGGGRWLAGVASAKNARLRGFGLVVDGDQVKRRGKVLGDLVSSRAPVTDPTSRHTLARVVTVVGAATTKTDATLVVAFADGNVHTWSIKSAKELRQAQTWVAKFNALADAAALAGQAAAGNAAP